MLLHNFSIKIAVFLSALIFGFDTCLADPVPTSTISRLQYRLNDNKSYSLTESVYHRFSNNAYVLQIADIETHDDIDDRLERYELNAGFPTPALNNSTSLVGRAQKYSSYSEIYAAGVQLDLNRQKLLSEPMKNYGLVSFIQFFAKNNPDGMGDSELLTYFQINKNKYLPLDIRGNLVEYIGGDLTNFWFDAIYAVRPEVDVYFRWNYLSNNSPILGPEGTVSSLGIRFNFRSKQYDTPKSMACKQQAIPAEHYPATNRPVIDKLYATA